LEQIDRLSLLEIVTQEEVRSLEEQMTVFENTILDIVQMNIALAAGCAAHDTAVAAHDAAVAERDAAVASYENSKSWKLTAPMRKMARRFKKLHKIVKRKM
jgi:hypothetical protein